MHTRPDISSFNLVRSLQIIPVSWFISLLHSPLTLSSAHSEARRLAAKSRDSTNLCPRKPVTVVCSLLYLRSIRQHLLLPFATNSCSFSTLRSLMRLACLANCWNRCVITPFSVAMLRQNILLNLKASVPGLQTHNQLHALTVLKKGYYTCSESIRVLNTTKKFI